MTTLLAILFVGAVSLAAVAAIAWPIVAGGPGAEGPLERQSVEAEQELERALVAIKEIEFDHRAGSLSDADYGELRTEAERRAVAAMRRRDELVG